MSEIDIEQSILQEIDQILLLVTCTSKRVIIFYNVWNRYRTIHITRDRPNITISNMYFETSDNIL